MMKDMDWTQARQKNEEKRSNKVVGISVGVQSPSYLTEKRETTSDSTPNSWPQGSLLGTFHGSFAHSRPRPVRSDDDGAGNQCSVEKNGDHVIAALVERDVDERCIKSKASVPESAPKFRAAEHNSETVRENVCSVLRPSLKTSSPAR